MANEPVRPRIMDFLEHNDGFAHVGGIARGAQVSRNSVRTVLDELEAAGQLETGPAASDDPDGRRHGNVGYRLRKPS
jgi:hypothetical protein